MSNVGEKEGLQETESAVRRREAKRHYIPLAGSVS